MLHSPRNIVNELLIGLTLAIVVLPQAIAFSTTLAGLPPYFGIYVAVWGVLFTAFLNPSRVFHGGPNSTLSAVMGVTLVPVAPQFGADYMGYALTLVLMAGLVQLLFMLIRPLTKLLDLMSEAVINGMICGIGLFLIFKSLTAFGGLPINTEVEWPLLIAWHSFLSVLEIGNIYAIQIGMVTLVVAIVVRSFPIIKNWGILAGIIAGTVYSEHINSVYGLENTLVEQTADFSAIGFVFPSVPLFTQEALPDIINIMPGAVTLAMLGLFQTVAAMRRMNRKIGQHVDSSEGIASDAISNCILPFLSSLPTCASFNRMWLMYSMGAKTRLVAVSSAVILLSVVLLASKWIAIIPIPAMAAVIMIVGANMIKWSDIRPHFSNWPEAIIFSSAFVSVHILGLFGAVIIGSILALLHFKWRKLHPEIMLENGILKIRGSLYYGSLPFIERKMKEVTERGLRLHVDLSETNYIDAEGERWLEDMVNNKQLTVIPH
jgi:SulP family sulfate permease